MTDQPNFHIKKHDFNKIRSKIYDSRHGTRNNQEDNIIKNSDKSSKEFQSNKPNVLFRKKKVKQENIYKLQNDGVGYQQYLVTLMQQLQPRDQMIVIPYNSIKGGFSLKDDIKKFQQWLGDMQFSVTSTAFGHMLSKKLTFEEVKIFCSQNIMLNLLLFLQNVNPQETYQIMKYVNNKMKDNLEYLMVKYPLTKQGVPNKKLREAISSVNNLENDENDILQNSGVKFLKNESEDYTGKIMEFINYLITFSGEQFEYLGNKTTYSKAFNQIIEKIFEWVEFPQDIVSEDDIFSILTQVKQEQKQSPEDPNNYEPQIMFSEDDQQMSQMSIQMQQNNFEVPQSIKMPQRASPKIAKKRLPDRKNKKVRSYKQIMINKQEQGGSLNEKQLKEYRQKVKSYTSYRIGSKINPNTELYSENQILFGDFSIKSTALLRIMTKWIQQLRNKIQKSHDLLMKRTFRFKTNIPNNFVKLDSIEKNKLYQAAQKYLNSLKMFEGQMLKQCFGVEANLAKNINEQRQSSNIPKFQYFVGIFGTKLESAASTYLLNYLNRLISILLNIPKEANMQKNQAVQRKKNKASCQDVNLVTFKVSDLLRCKCSSHQDEILKILNLFKRISDNRPDIFKIVRIKDRLQLGTKDILININFANKVLCQIQLGIVGQIEEKIKMYDRFSHYLYELHRSSLGPLMECSCIWVHLDQRSKQFKKFIKPKFSMKQMNNSITHINCQSAKMQVYNYSFVCSICQNYYSYLPGLIKNLKCVSCKVYYECRNCIQAKMSEKQLKIRLKFSDSPLNNFDQSFRIWKSSKYQDLPSFGFLIPKKANHLRYYFCQRVRLLGKDVFITIVEKQVDGIKQLKIQTIYETKNDSQTEINNFEEQFFILEWTESRFINRTLKSDARIKKMEEQAQRKQLEYIKMKQQKQKKKKQIQKKKQELKKAFLEIQEEDDEYSDSENQRNNKKNANKNKKEDKIKHQKVKEKIIEKTTTNQMNVQSASRANSSKSSRSNYTNKSKQGPVSQQIQKFVKKSDQNDIRVDIKTAGGCTYILLLGFYMQQSQIRAFLKQIRNQKIIRQLLDSRNQVLSLEQQQIKSQISQQLMTSDQIKHLNGVSQLYLDDNKIDGIDFIKYSPKIRILSASNNIIQDISPLQNLKNLYEINFQGNQIYQMNGISDKPKLTQLYLGSNQISQISNLDRLPRLKILNLSNNALYVIKNLDRLSSLEQLDLSGNCIKQISGLSQLKNITNLNLANNQITEIAGLDNNVNLTILNLSLNHLKKIQNVDHLQKLQVLGLQSNEIDDLNTQHLNKLSSLTQLNLSHNLINLSQKTIFNIPALQKLYFSKNRIQKFTIENFDCLKALQVLDLSHNRITKIYYDIFHLLKHLKELTLIGNPYKKTDKKTLQSIRKMHQQNKICKIKIN